MKKLPLSSPLNVSPFTLNLHPLVLPFQQYPGKSLLHSLCRHYIIPELYTIEKIYVADSAEFVVDYDSSMLMVRDKGEVRDRMLLSLKGSLMDSLLLKVSVIWHLYGWERYLPFTSHNA